VIDDPLIVSLLQQELPGLVAVYRFGSTSTGDARRGSDVDVAVLVEDALDPVRRFELQERLAALLRRDVDLVDLRSASTVLRMQVVAHGCLLCAPDDAERGRFEDGVFSSYARLNEERRAILERVDREGRVYGG